MISNLHFKLSHIGEKIIFFEQLVYSLSIFMKYISEILFFILLFPVEHFNIVLSQFQFIFKLLLH